MADGPTDPGRLTPKTVETAQSDKLEAFAKALVLVGGATGLNYRLNAPGGPLVQAPLKFGLTGIEAKPSPTGRASLSFPKASFLSAFLPAPVGYVPAEAYNLHPEFFIQSFGRPIGSKPFGFEATQERKDVFAARQLANAIAARALGVPTGDESTLRRTGFKIPPGPINITRSELAFLQSLPPGVAEGQNILPAFAGRFGDIRPSNNGPQTVTLNEFGPAATGPVLRGPTPEQAAAAGELWFALLQLLQAQNPPDP